MKKSIKRILFVLLILLSFFGCSSNNINLPQFSDSQCYYSDGFQDYTDYCKYFYDENGIDKFSVHSQFKEVAETDIENIKSYFTDFENRVKTEEYYENYDFDYSTQIKAGDYYCIITCNSTDIFADYDVYYYDTEKCILYYIHSNT